MMLFRNTDAKVTYLIDKGQLLYEICWDPLFRQDRGIETVKNNVSHVWEEQKWEKTTFPLFGKSRNEKKQRFPCLGKAKMKKNNVSLVWERQK
ncbi:hypothetical protein [Hoylesella enoeca]|nr:hypothetical protein [Hoylesella enoeca]